MSGTAAVLNPSDLSDTRTPSAPTRSATFIGAAQYRRKSYGANHPLAIPRVSLTFDLINSYGALTSDEYLVARKAADFELEWFHTREYVSAIKRVEALGRVNNDIRQRHALGTLENPYFDGIYTIPCTATGASIQAAEQLIAGRVAFNPAGGMHHARPAHAQGFCYFNDPVLAVMRLRKHGWRVMYVDIDAHHGDGVELAFREDSNVLTMSLHMDTRYAYPFEGGRVTDAGSEKNAYATINIPLPRGIGDAAYRAIFNEVFAAALQRFTPDAMVLQAGTDMLFADPLGKFSLSTQAFLDIVETIYDHAPYHADGTPRLLVTGGGGYHPLLLARAWTGLWAILSGRNLPDEIPAAGARALRGAGWDADDDEPYYARLFESLSDVPVTPQSSVHELDDLRAALARHPFLK